MIELELIYANWASLLVDYKRIRIWQYARIVRGLFAIVEFVSMASIIACIDSTSACVHV